MNQSDLEQYLQYSSSIHRLETELDGVRRARQELAARLVAANGKGHTYLINGKEMQIRTSRSGTHFFAPPLGRGRKKAEAEASVA